MRPWTLREASQKATNWSGNKNGKSFKEIWLSWYQSTDKMHFWVCVKFEDGSSNPFTRKMGSKKSETFSKVCPFFKLINEKLSLRATNHFCLQFFFFASSLPVHHFFFFTSTLAPHHKQLSLYTTTLYSNLLAPLTSSLLLHSLAHYTRLVIPRQVLYLFSRSPFWNCTLTIVSFC
jgi:hypothetical protein